MTAGKNHDIEFARLELLKLLATVPEIETSVSSDFADDGKAGCSDESPDFIALASACFAAHPPIAPFKAQVTRGDHCMTAGLRGFRIEDELSLSRRTAASGMLLPTAFAGNCPKF